MITFYMPEDVTLRAVIGAVAIRHGQLDYVLRMTVKSLAALTVGEAIDATEREGSAKLREQVIRLARQRLGEGQALLKLKAILTRCRRATEKRNEILHGLFARALDGGELWRHEGQEWRDLPSVAELEKLAMDLSDIAVELNTARLDGWLSAALEQFPLAPGAPAARPTSPQPVTGIPTPATA